MLQTPHFHFPFPQLNIKNGSFNIITNPSLDARVEYDVSVFADQRVVLHFFGRSGVVCGFTGEHALLEISRRMRQKRLPLPQVNYLGGTYFPISARYYDNNFSDITYH